MASDECQGKGSWPELVGVKGEVAKATIERENPLVTAKIVVEGVHQVPMNYQCDRVWVWVDKAGIVVRVPIIG
ncbi:Proteinase inhibitor I13, potato inhibitor I [Corchorus olitorius]|uniref:Proteinase inhibitor I13, potato inhibitor I n=1 Tax=Corchorus olitorius TaxID=93759 RepID=A0A1R3K215_9ROSI|nr:Proteinase inhibitor I13, potato inhibitor I [Corchorus olitorius]